MKDKTKNLSAVIALVAFVTTQVTAPFSAFANQVQTEIKVSASFELNLPPDLGTVESLHAGSGPTVIHIQTAHGNYEAQKKIQSLLHYLKDSYGIKTVLVEGSASKLNPEILRLFPEEGLNMEIADELAKKALVKAPDLFLIEEKSAEGYGIENLKAYRENAKAFKAVLKEREKTEGFLKDMDMQIERLTSPYLNKDLRGFLKRLESYSTEHSSMAESIAYLKTEAAKRLNIDLSNPSYQLEWPMLVRIAKLGEFEAKINLEDYHKERDVFLKAIEKNEKADTSKNEATKECFEKVKKLLSATLGRQELPNPETSLLFESMISALPADFNYNAYPNLKLFVGHLILQSEVQGSVLMDEIIRLEDRIATSLAVTETEKKILLLLKDYGLLKKLFALELSPSDYEMILKRRSDIKPSKAIQHFLKLNSSKRVRDAKFSHTKEINSLFERALDFYRFAKERDRLMAENVLTRIKETGADKVAVITGGFHAEPFRHFFSEKGFNYALVSPKFTTLDGREAYIHSILQKEFASRSTMESPTLEDPARILTGISDTRYESKEIAGTIVTVTGKKGLVTAEGPAIQVSINSKLKEGHVEFLPVAGRALFYDENGTPLKVGIVVPAVQQIISAALRSELREGEEKTAAIEKAAAASEKKQTIWEKIWQGIYNLIAGIVKSLKAIKNRILSFGNLSQGTSNRYTPRVEGLEDRLTPSQTTPELINNFFAYDTKFTGGVRITSGDVNGDGISDIITGAGKTGGPHVKVFSNPLVTPPTLPIGNPPTVPNPKPGPNRFEPQTSPDGRYTVSYRAEAFSSPTPPNIRSNEYLRAVGPGLNQEVRVANDSLNVTGAGFNVTNTGVYYVVSQRSNPPEVRFIPFSNFTESGIMVITLPTDVTSHGVQGITFVGGQRGIIEVTGNDQVVRRVDLTTKVVTVVATEANLNLINVATPSDLSIVSSPNNAGTISQQNGVVNIQFGVGNFTSSASGTLTYSVPLDLSNQTNLVIGLQGDVHAFQNTQAQPLIVAVKDVAGHTGNVELPGIATDERVWFIPTSLLTGINLQSIQSISFGVSGYNITDSYVSVHVNPTITINLNTTVILDPVYTPIAQPGYQPPAAGLTTTNTTQGDRLSLYKEIIPNVGTFLVIGAQNEDGTHYYRMGNFGNVNPVLYANPQEGLSLIVSGDPGVTHTVNGVTSNYLVGNLIVYDNRTNRFYLGGIAGFYLNPQQVSNVEPTTPGFKVTTTNHQVLNITLQGVVQPTTTPKHVEVIGDIASVTTTSLEYMRKAIEGSHGFGAGTVKAYIYEVKPFNGLAAIDVFYRLTASGQDTYYNVTLVFDANGNLTNMGWVRNNPPAAALPFRAVGYESISQLLPNVTLPDVTIKTLTLKGTPTLTHEDYQIVYQVQTPEGVREFIFNGQRNRQTPNNGFPWTYQVSAPGMVTASNPGYYYTVISRGLEYAVYKTDGTLVATLTHPTVGQDESSFFLGVPDVSPDGKYIVFGWVKSPARSSIPPTYYIALYDTANGNKVRDIQIIERGPTGLFRAVENVKFAAGSSEIAEVLFADGGKINYNLLILPAGYTPAISNANFAFKSQIVNGLQLQLTLLNRITGQTQILSVASVESYGDHVFDVRDVSPNGQYVVFAIPGNKAQVQRIDNPSLSKVVDLNTHAGLGSIEWTTTSPTVVLIGKDQSRTTVSLTQLSPAPLQSGAQPTPSNFSFYYVERQATGYQVVYDVYKSNGQLVATVNKNTTITAVGGGIEEIIGLPDVSQDGKYLIAAQWDSIQFARPGSPSQSIQIFDVLTGQLVGRIQLPAPGAMNDSLGQRVNQVTSVLFVPGSSTMAQVVFPSGEVKFYNILTRTEVGSSIASTQTSPNGQYIVTHIPGFLVLTNPAGTELGRIQVEGGVAFINGFSITNNAVYFSGDQRSNLYLQYATFSNFTQAGIQNVTLPAGIAANGSNSVSFVGPGLAYIRGYDFVNRFVNLETQTASTFGIAQIGLGEIPRYATSNTILLNYNTNNPVFTPPVGIRIVYSTPLNVQNNFRFQLLNRNTTTSILGNDLDFIKIKIQDPQSRFVELAIKPYITSDGFVQIPASVLQAQNITQIAQVEVVMTQPGRTGLLQIILPPQSIPAPANSVRATSNPNFAIRLDQNGPNLSANVINVQTLAITTVGTATGSNATVGVVDISPSGVAAIVPYSAATPSVQVVRLDGSFQPIRLDGIFQDVVFQSNIATIETKNPTTLQIETTIVDLQTFQILSRFELRQEDKTFAKVDLDQLIADLSKTEPKKIEKVERGATWYDFQTETGTAYSIFSPVVLENETPIFKIRIQTPPGEPVFVGDKKVEKGDFGYDTNLSILPTLTATGIIVPDVTPTEQNEFIKIYETVTDLLKRSELREPVLPIPAPVVERTVPVLVTPKKTVTATPQVLSSTDIVLTKTFTALIIPIRIVVTYAGQTVEALIEAAKTSLGLTLVSSITPQTESVIEAETGTVAGKSRVAENAVKNTLKDFIGKKGTEQITAEDLGRVILPGFWKERMLHDKDALLGILAGLSQLELSQPVFAIVGDRDEFIKAAQSLRNKELSDVMSQVGELLEPSRIDQLIRFLAPGDLQNYIRENSQTGAGVVNLYDGKQEYIDGAVNVHLSENLVSPKDVKVLLPSLVFDSLLLGKYSLGAKNPSEQNKNLAEKLSKIYYDARISFTGAGYQFDALKGYIAQLLRSQRYMRYISQMA